MPVLLVIIAGPLLCYIPHSCCEKLLKPDCRPLRVRRKEGAGIHPLGSHSNIVGP